MLKPIGKGKFAVVYRAQRTTDGLIGIVAYQFEFAYFI